MEQHKRSCRQGRKKVELSMSSTAGGGGGIERVVVLGGALAVASLIAAFTFKKSSSNDSNTDATNLAATDSCCSKEEGDGNEGLRFILQDSTSTLDQNSCCTNHGTSKIGITQIETFELVSTQSLITLEEKTMQCERKGSVGGQQEILVHDAEQESIAATGNYSDIEELSRVVGVGDNKPMNGAKNEGNVTSVMETIEIEIEDEAVNVDAEWPAAEESSTLQSSLSTVPSNEEEKLSISKGEEDEEDYSVMQSSFSTEDDEDKNEEEEYSPRRSSFAILEDDGIGEEEKEEEDLLMQSSLLAEEDEEEYSPIRSSFSKEEDRIGEEEKEEDEHSPMELSFSTEEGKKSPFSTEEDDENGENVPGIEEEGSEGTWSSSPEANMEVIHPAEMMGVLSPESKEMNISHRVSVKKSEKDLTAKIETYHYLAKTFEERGSNDGKNNKETQEVVVISDRKEHSAKRHIRVLLGLVLLLLFLLTYCLLLRNYLSNSVSFVFTVK